MPMELRKFSNNLYIIITSSSMRMRARSFSASCFRKAVASGEGDWDTLDGSIALITCGTQQVKIIRKPCYQNSNDNSTGHLKL